MNDASGRMEAARHAAKVWAQTSVKERMHRLQPLRYALARRIDEVVALLVEETGKAPQDALTGDVMVLLEHLRYCEHHAARVLRERGIGKPAFLYKGAQFTEVREPHGVVLIFAPWNYPLQLAAVPMTTALYAGNAVVLKCSDRTPRTAALIESLCRQAGLPEGLVQVSCEGPEQAGALLDARPDFFFFTGSSRNGRALLEKAAALMIPAAMELGGNDAALVFASCDLQRTVNGLAYGAFANAGQVCSGVRRIYVEKRMYESFLPAFLERVKGLSPEDMGRVQDDVRERVRGICEAMTAAGATVHRCGEVAVVTGLAEDAAYFREESFGPIVSVTTFEDEEDALRLARVSSFALGATVWSGDRVQAQRIARKVPAGVVCVNDAIRVIGNPYAAFGGNGGSGFGRYHGEEGLRTFSRVRSIMTVGEGRRREIHWFPFDRGTYESVRKLMVLRHGEGSLMRRIASLVGKRKKA